MQASPGEAQHPVLWALLSIHSLGSSFSSHFLGTPTLHLVWGWAYQGEQGLALNIEIWLDLKQLSGGMQ